MKIYTLNDLFELNVSNNTGIYFLRQNKQDTYLSYKLLYKKSLELLFHLQSAGLGPGSELVFQIEDNEEFIIAFWACLLGGIIPVPLPVCRNAEQILKLNNVVGALHNPSIYMTDYTWQFIGEIAGKNSLHCELAQIEAKRLIIKQPSINEKEGAIFRAQPHNTAFIQFSSGSTGDPKGVELTHSQILMNVIGIIKSSKACREDSILSWMPLTHNMGLIGFHIAPFAAGVNQYIMSTELFLTNPVLWMQKIHENRITITASPNFGYKHFLKFLGEGKDRGWDLSHVKVINNGAEPISYDICNEFFTAMSWYGLKRSTMLAAYGMAETAVAISFTPAGEELMYYDLDRDCITVGQTVKEADRRDSLKKSTFVDVGYPIEGCSIRICDDTENIVDDGIVGHIQVKGSSVMKGYYNNPAANEKVFTSDGWLETGDLGFTKNGRLIVTGRAKDIIFINGKNYYPHDFETLVEGLCDKVFGNVAACSVKNDVTHAEEIVIFVESKMSCEEFSKFAAEVQKHINRHTGLDIKDIVPVELMPRTNSGKIQRYKLAEMYKQGQISTLSVSSEEYVHNPGAENPKNADEIRLLKICRKVLDKKGIGMTDNLLEAGMNSLKAAIIVSEINKEFNVELPLAELFKAACIGDAAGLIGRAKTVQHSSIQKAAPMDYYPASAQQRRMYALNRIDPESTNYNITSALWIYGNLDYDRFKEAMNKLIQRHDALRTSFLLVDVEPVQKIRDTVDFEIEYMELDQAGANAYLKSFVKPFDLTKAPLLRVALIKVASEKHLFLLDMHHIITDGTSMGTIIREFAALYEGLALPELTIQYKDYGLWQRDRLESGSFRAKEEYWLNRFKGEVPELAMPLDYPRPMIQSFEGDRVKFSTGEELAAGLYKLALETGTTLYMVLMAAYSILLSKCSAQEDIVIGSPIAGRPHPDLAGIVGMFVNTIALRHNPAGSKVFAQYLQEVKENALSAYENQDYQLDWLVERLKIKKKPGRNQLFDAMFNMQNMDIPELKIANLKFVPCELEDRTTRADLILVIAERENDVKLELVYCTRLFNHNTIQGLSRHFLNILSAITVNPHIKISEISVLSEDEMLSCGSQMKNEEKESELEIKFDF